MVQSIRPVRLRACSIWTTWRTGRCFCSQRRGAIPFRPSMTGNPGLLMFYALGPMRRACYYLPELEAVAVLVYEGSTVHVFDIFGEGDDLSEALNACALPDTAEAVLGFTPKKTEGLSVSVLHEEDTTLFVRGEAGMFIRDRKLRFGELSHA